MIQYYYRDHPTKPRYFARVTREAGLPSASEWRLSWPEKHVWVELHGAPVLGWLLDGDTSLDPVDVDDVPVLLSAATIELAAA